MKECPGAAGFRRRAAWLFADSRLSGSGRCRGLAKEFAKPQAAVTAWLCESQI